MRRLFTFNHLLLVTLLVFVSCSRRDFLNEKPTTNLIVPKTLQDLQLMLDAQQVFFDAPHFGELSSDNYYLTFADWQALPFARTRNAYIWAKDIFEGQGSQADWNIPYNQIFYCNAILETLASIPVDNTNIQFYNSVKGSGLFLRAFAFYNLSQIFCSIYDSTSANVDLGLPLKLTSDVNIIVGRSSVQQTYDLIIRELKESMALLPPTRPASNLNRPSKPAAYAVLARLYLSARSYKEAKLYADSSLQLYNTLIDYNTVPATGTPFLITNAETIYQSRLINSENAVLNSSVGKAILDSSLYSSYAANDLRKTVFFTVTAGLPRMRPTYTGSTAAFSGLATDEMFLIRAEGYAREGNIAVAMKDLNDLLRTRWKKIAGVTTYVDQTATSSGDALNKILTERRKELPFRGLRWSDLRRLNKEGYNITLTRLLNGQSYTLTPNSSRYVLPIPPDEIVLSGIPQNIRD